MSNLRMLSLGVLLVVWTLLWAGVTAQSNLRRVNDTQLSAADAKDKAWCISMRDKYNIEPGRSFGSLPYSEHNRYLQARCYRFFCKPHPLAGKGVFKCEPLED
eukprot:gene9935-gene10747